MLLDFFKKNEYKEINFFHSKLISEFADEIKNVQFKKRPATYNKSFLAKLEFLYKNNKVIIIHEASAIKRNSKEFSTTFIANVQNPSWISLLICPRSNSSSFTRNLSNREVILKKISDTYFVSTSENSFIKEDKVQVFKILQCLSKDSFKYLKVERKKLTGVIESIPIDEVNGRDFMSFFELFVKLAEKVDLYQKDN